jgi:hypothetical protein
MEHPHFSQRTIAVQMTSADCLAFGAHSAATFFLHLRGVAGGKKPHNGAICEPSSIIERSCSMLIGRLSRLGFQYHSAGGK